MLLLDATLWIYDEELRRLLTRFWRSWRPTSGISPLPRRSLR
jgi:hypothetical protein